MLKNWLKSFGKLKATAPQERLQCRRCHSIASSPKQRAEYAHYTPHCSGNCRDWALLEAELAKEAA